MSRDSVVVPPFRVVFLDGVETGDLLPSNHENELESILRTGWTGINMVEDLCVLSHD